MGFVLISTQSLPPENTNHKISYEVHRTGYHFRGPIVDEARAILGDTGLVLDKRAGDIEPIPESQEEINKQADAAIRDIFPRIPNTDRQMIIEHAFRKVVPFYYPLFYC